MVSLADLTTHQATDMLAKNGSRAPPPREEVELAPVDLDKYTKKRRRGDRRARSLGHEGTEPTDCCGKLVIHPHHEARLVWDTLATVFLIFNIVSVPLRLAFDEFNECPEALWVFEAVVDWFFVADICLNFRTGVFVIGQSGAISTSLRAIAWRYAKTWLLIDLASSIPLDFVVSLTLNGCHAQTNAHVGAQSEDQGSSDGLDALKLLRALRLAKLLKLLRLFRLSRLLDNLQDHVPINTVLSKATTMIICTLYTGHLTGCVWYAVGRANVQAGEPSWLVEAGLVLHDANNTAVYKGLDELYVASLYWAFTTMTTVGYGDLTPMGLEEQLVAILAMMVGAPLFGYIMLTD